MRVAKEQWYSLTKASEKLGYSRAYVSLWLRRHKDDFPEEMIMQSGNSKMISETGVKWIEENTKKRAPSSAIDLLMRINT